MAKSETIEVNPRVLEWLRERSGWNIAEVAESLRTGPRVISELESGGSVPPPYHSLR
ncbi:MAG: helix-turn-helix transcriptional regulator [Thaumarchaeota archaeon]|nr:helix-turn-helix transcriptional regulator [Nitrososphaerota archaeon]